MSEYGDNIISISDDEGNDFELLVLDEADMNGVHYLALTEAKNPEEEENLEVIILKVIQDEESGEDLLSTVDSDDELEAIYQIFEDQMFADDDGPGMLYSRCCLQASCRTCPQKLEAVTAAGRHPTCRSVQVIIGFTRSKRGFFMPPLPFSRQIPGFISSFLSYFYELF